MLQNRPPTWVRLRRIQLREIATLIANEAMKLNPLWPKNGEGRAVKKRTEIIMQRTDGGEEIGNLSTAFHNLTLSIRDLENIRNNKFFQEFLAPKTVKIRDDKSVPIGVYLDNIINDTDRYIGEYVISQKELETKAHIEDVAESVPKQQEGPAIFVVSDGYLQVLHQPATANLSDSGNANLARLELMKSAEEIGELLQSGNHDPRLVALTSDLKARLESQQDIIQLGIANISYQMACEGVSEEMSAVEAARLRGFTLSINMYLAQFPAWSKFAENAAWVDLSVGDVTMLFAEASKLVEHLEASPLVNPEVPKTLAFLLEAIRTPRRAARRAIFAVVRTVENLFSAVMQTFFSTFSSAQEGLRSGVKYMTSALVIGLGATAIALSPLILQTSNSNWLAQAIRFALKLLENTG